MKKHKSFIGVVLATLLGIAPLMGATTMSVKPNGCKGPSLCGAAPVIDGCGWHLDIGLLLEQMRVGNANFFYEHGGLTSETGASWNNPFRTDDMCNMTFNIEAGVKAGIGYYSVHDDWEVNASFEWLYSKAILNADTASGTFQPTYNIDLSYGDDQDTTLSFHQGNSNLSVNYYLLDITLSKGSYFSDHFSFEPLAGVKVSWIGYNGALSLKDNQNTATSIPSNVSWLRRNVTNFWGIGPMIGLNANYHMFVGWSIFSHTNVAVLLGETKIKDGVGFVTIEKYPFDSVTYSILNTLTPTIRSIVGLQYDMDMFEETQHLKLRFGFDGRWYYNQFPTVDRRAKRIPSETGIVLSTNSCVYEGNAFGMIGFLLDLGWDY